MALAPGIECDAEMLETLRLALAKISPSELDIYAGSSPAFARGGFRPGKTQLVRERILAMLASKEPVEEPLRRLLRDHVRRSLESGGGAARLQKALDDASAELLRLKGATAKLEKESAAREQAERRLAAATAEADRAATAESELRRQLEQAESKLRRIVEDEAGYIEAVLQVRLAKEMAAFFAAPPKAAEADAPTSPTIFEKVAAAIAGAPDRQLASWKSDVDRMAAAGVFTPDEHAGLLAAVRHRYTALHMQGFEKMVPKDGETQKPAGIFSLALAGKIPAILLIDAHNALFALQSRYRLPNEHRWPTAQTRKWFTEDIVQLLENAPNFRAYIVFDGPERSESAASANVLVIYSGGTGEHRADKVIVDQARFLSEAGAENLLIATNDGELAGLAAHHGAKCIAPTLLLSVL